MRVYMCGTHVSHTPIRERINRIEARTFKFATVQKNRTAQHDKVAGVAAIRSIYLRVWKSQTDTLQTHPHTHIGDIIGGGVRKYVEHMRIR